jgi:hypothetical protein
VQLQTTDHKLLKIFPDLILGRIRQM